MIPQQCSQFELFGIVSSNTSYVNALSYIRNFEVCCIGRNWRVPSPLLYLMMTKWCIDLFCLRSFICVHFWAIGPFVTPNQVYNPIITIWSINVIYPTFLAPHCIFRMHTVYLLWNVWWCLTSICILKDIFVLLSILIWYFLFLTCIVNFMLIFKKAS